jgi:hypothetical protein
VVPRQNFPNSTLARRSDGANTPASPATQGIGPQITVTPQPITYREDDRNVPSAYVELVGPEGSLGTWLVSPDLGSPQAFTYAGHSWKIVLRPARVYKPFAVTLLETRHDVYPGTDIPKNFSSRIRIGAPGAADQREVLIYMNNPLRYEGLTFYQYQMDPGHNASVLQVVRNPGWILPYIACSMMCLGLCWQFLQHLVGFFQKRRAATAAESAA